MKLTVLLATILFAFASAGKAAPLCVDGGKMADYHALGAGGCVIGNALFSNFVYGSTAFGNGIPVADTAVTLTPVDGAQGPGIIFSSNNWSVSANASMPSQVDSTIKFTVTTLDGSPVIGTGILTLSSSSWTGTGTGDIGETINPSGTMLEVYTGASGVVSVSSKEIPLTNTVSVLKDLRVNVPMGVAGSGFAQITSFEEDFSEAPEPVSTVLIWSGLLGLGFWRRRVASRG
jgi:hypothetical protein